MSSKRACSQGSQCYPRGKRACFRHLICAKCCRLPQDGEIFQAGNTTVNCARYCRSCWETFDDFQGALEEELARIADDGSARCSTCRGKASDESRGTFDYIPAGKCCNLCPDGHGPLCTEIRCAACFKSNTRPLLDNGDYAFSSGGWRVNYAYYCAGCWRGYCRTYLEKLAEVDAEELGTPEAKMIAPRESTVSTTPDSILSDSSAGSGLFG